MSPQVYDGRLKHPFSLICSGPSQSGKSTFICDFVKNHRNCVDTTFDNIYWFYGVETQMVKNDQEFCLLGTTIQFVEGLPEDLEQYIDEERTNMLIFDDLMDQAVNSQVIVDLFTKNIHHKNISCILSLQNYFHNGQNNRGLRSTIERNTNYLVLFPNKLDNSSISTIAHRIMPKNSKLFINVFETACKNGRYLFIDGKQSSHPSLKFRTDIAKDIQKIYTV